MLLGQLAQQVVKAPLALMELRAQLALSAHKVSPALRVQLDLKDFRALLAQQVPEELLASKALLELLALKDFRVLQV